MSDFSELCPLFYTGVYKEVCFPAICSLTASPATVNLFESKTSAGIGTASAFSFGRTVVVTGAFVNRYGGTNTAAENVQLQHRMSASAAATVIGSLLITNTLSAEGAIWCWQPVTMVGSATFTSNEILGFGFGTVTETQNGWYNLIVRYREK